MNTDTQEQERVMNIVVNGKEYKVGQQLSYEEAVRLALGRESAALQTVTYYARLGKSIYTEGFLTPGESVEAVDGMEVDVAFTGNA